MELEELSQTVDITNCEKEPIHIIGKIQSHGALISCDPSNLKILQCSTNCDGFFGVSSSEMLTKSVEAIIGEEAADQLRKNIKRKDFSVPDKIAIGDREFFMLPHFSGENLVLDFEPVGALLNPVKYQKKLSSILGRLKAREDEIELCREAAALAKQLFDYDRVMLYRFDEEWNGEVVAEEKLPDAESWLGLHYPASDIPAQARKMFLTNKLRIIADVAYQPAPIIPEISPMDQQPLDLSKSNLRAVSPIHIEYLENMGVGASLTAAIIVNNRLWGLIACHHNSAKFLDYYERQSCSFLAEVLSNQLSVLETNKFLVQLEQSSRTADQLKQQMYANEDLVQALCLNQVKFSDLVSCGGGALVLDDEIHLIGKTPTEQEVRELLNIFIEQKEDLYYTNNLSSEFSNSKNYTTVSSGVLSLRVSRNQYLLWFRPEVLQTVNWGGNPQHKVTYNEEKKRLSPRKSFEKWTQQRKGIAIAWKESEIKAAKDFGEDVRYVILEQQKNEIDALNKSLLEANKELQFFSYGLSHDLRAPIRGIDGFIDILREDHAGSLDESGKEILKMLSQMVNKTEVLIEDILSFFKVGAGEVKAETLSVNHLVEEVLQVYNPQINFPKTKIEVQQDMPAMYGDRRMLFQAWNNIIGNALKYSSKAENPKVEIGCTNVEGDPEYFVRDNGIGIKIEHQEKIFEAFSRVAGNDYTGTGIGLALVKRIIEKHNGQIWVESAPQKGSTFIFRLALEQHQKTGK